MKYLLLFFIFTACATTRVCQTVEQEPISVCRAEVACEPNAGQRFAAGYSGQMSSLMANKNLCVMNNIEAQKANAGIKLLTGPKD